MLVEFLGWPGSGKSTMARALSTAAEGSRTISNWTRHVNVARAMLRPERLEANELITELCSRFARAPVASWRRAALLRGDRAIALAAQATPQICIADELLLHVVFGTVGPRDNLPDELLQMIAALVDRTYLHHSVAFVYLRPSLEDWERRLRNRPAGRSRYGKGADEGLLLELKRDQLLDRGIAGMLAQKGFRVVTASPSNQPGASVVYDCRQAIESHFSR